MQLVIHIELDEPLLLPVNYNHILQAVIYRSLDIIPGYAEFMKVDSCGARGSTKCFNSVS